MYPAPVNPGWAVAASGPKAHCLLRLVDDRDADHRGLRRERVEDVVAQARRNGSPKKPAGPVARWFRDRGIDTLGVCFLHSYANPDHEERMRDVLLEEHPAAVVSISSEVLREYREVMDRHGVTKVRASATSAARDAVNRDEFFDAAEAVIGVRPELLSGLEEGRLSFLGATSELDSALDVESMTHP